MTETFLMPFRCTQYNDDGTTRSHIQFLPVRLESDYITTDKTQIIDTGVG